MDNGALGGTVADAQPPLSIDASDPTKPVISGFGDSIMLGTGATTNAKKWMALVATARPAYNVINNSAGGREFYDFAATAAQRDDLVRRFYGDTPRYIWIETSTNDWGSPHWTAAQFGTAYADVLDRIHALMPTVQVFAQSAIYRNSPPETNINAFGNTLADFRTAIASACSGRSWCTYIDGSALVDYPANYGADLIHPNDAGHVQLKNAMLAALGI